MAESLQQTIQNTRGALLSQPGAPEFTTRNESVDALTLYKQKREREAQNTAGDYFGAMWRQDSPVDGLMASVVGSEFAPDPNYAPYDPEEWKSLTAGIPQDYHHNFYLATSKQHALFIRQRLQDKLDDLQKLGDLGLAGNIGRIAFNLVEPTSLAAGIASGGVAKVLTGLSAAGRLARRARTVAESEKAAGAVAQAAGRMGSGKALAGGIAFGSVSEGAFEKLRQSVNFEDDSAGVAWAAFFGAMTTAPFAYLGSREWRRVANTAAAEQQTLETLRKVQTGETLTEADKAAVEVQQALSKRAHDVIYVNSQGEARTGLAQAPGDTIFVDSAGNASLSLKAREWIDDFKAQLRAETEARLNEMFPNRGKERVRPSRLSPEDRAKLEARVKREDEAWMAKKLAGTPVAGTSTKARLTDLAGGPEVRNSVLTQEQGSAIKARDARKAEWEAATAQLEARKQKELDALWAEGHVSRGDREVAMEQLQDDLRAVRAEFEAEQTARPDGEVAQPSQPEGTDVLWRDSDGRPETGKVVQVMPSGKLKIDLYPSLPGTKMKTPGGSMRYKFMHRSELDPDSPLFEDVTPEGFGPNTVGGAQAGNTNIQVDDVSPDFDNITNLARWRLDLFARLNKSENPAVKYLAHVLVRDAIGNSKEFGQRWTASERKKQWQRVLGGRFHAEAKDAFNEVRKIRGISLMQAENGAAKDFYEAISRVTRGDTDVLAANPDIAPQLQRAAKAMRDTYAALAELAKKAGLEGAENLTPDAAYVNRIWNHDAIRAMEATHGQDAVLEVLAGAIPGSAVQRYKKSPRYQQMVSQGKGTDADIRMAKAKGFLDAVKKLEFSPAIQDVHLMAHDMKALRAALHKEGLSDDHIDNIVDIMFEVKEGNGDAGNPTNLRFRFDLDETHTIGTQAGKLRLTDLMENDSRMLVDIYLNSMGGHTALADRGITSRAAFRRELDSARQWYADNQQSTKDAGQINEEIQMLEDIYSHITGRPMSMQHFNKEDRIAGALRAYARSSYLGQLGIAAAFEMANAMALTSIRAFMQHSGGFRGFIQAVRTGKIANRQLAQQIETWTGFGHDAVMSYARQSEITDFTYDRGLNKFENFGNKASHIVDVISGNRLFTSLSRQLSSAMFIQKHVNMAGRKLSAKQRARLVGQGVDDAAIDGMLASLKKHTLVGQNGSVVELKWEDWKKADPKQFDTYLLVLNREVRDAIQDHDLGEIPMFMHGTIGKIFGELRTFMVASHAKQFLKNAHYRDGTTASLWMMSFLGQSMAYALQTSMNFAHNPDELEKRLSLDRIAMSAVQRMSVAGALPSLMETGTFIVTGGDSLFKHGSTTNTDNRNLFATPTGMMVSKWLKGASVAVGAMNPFTDEIVTRQDVRDTISGLPGGNTFLMRNIIDMVSSNFPKSEAPEAP